MPKSGPFKIDGKDYETRANGSIKETEPAVAAITNTIPLRQLRRLKGTREQRLAQVREVITAKQALETTLLQEIADLDTLIANAR